MTRPDAASLQLTFDGYDRPARDRLFFAIMPDADAGRSALTIAEQLRRQRGLTARPLDPRRLHVSLHPLGDYDGLPSDIVAKARNAASGVRATAFTASFDRVGTFGKTDGHNPLVLTSRTSAGALTGLYLSLKEAMARSGLRGMRSGFTPHMTLLYDTTKVETGSVAPVSWVVRDFVLIHSLLGGTRYSVLGRWPLRGPDR